MLYEQYSLTEINENITDKRQSLLDILISRESVVDKLYELTARQRIIWILKEIDGYNQSEIAKIINRDNGLVSKEFASIKKIFQKIGL